MDDSILIIYPVAYMTSDKAEGYHRNAHGNLFDLSFKFRFYTGRFGKIARIILETTLKNKYMKAIIIMAVWTLSFVVAAVSVYTLGIKFWTAFIVFAAASVYIQRHQDELIGDVDRIFDFSDSDEEFKK